MLFRSNVGHFGVIWTKDGAQRKQLSWAFIESILHSFEDLIQTRIMKHIEADSHTHWRSLPPEARTDDPASELSAFKPHAQVLSHELRTPLQGIVGSLDLLQETIQQAIDGQTRLRTKDLQGLLENILTVQSKSHPVS